MKYSFLFLALMAIAPVCINASDAYELEKRKAVSEVPSIELREGVQELRARFRASKDQRTKLTFINSMIAILEELERRDELKDTELIFLTRLYASRPLFQPRRSR